MIETTVLDYLRDRLGVPVTMEVALGSLILPMIPAVTSGTFPPRK